MDLIRRVRIGYLHGACIGNPRESHVIFAAGNSVFLIMNAYGIKEFLLQSVMENL